MADQKTSIVITAVDKASATLKNISGGMENLGGVAGALIPQMGALAGALSIGGILAFGKGAIDAADNLNDLSQRVGIGIKDLATWKLAADQSGTSLETVAKSVKSLSVYMVEHADRLKAAGITATDANGALIQLADIFAAMPDGVGKTALAVELFGKSGMDMIPMLNQGSRGLDDAAKKAKEYGERMAELAPQADRFNDQLTELSMNVSIVGVAIASTLAKPTSDWIAANLEGIRIAGSFTEMLRLFVFNLDAMTTQKPREEIRRLTDELKQYQDASSIGKFFRSPFGGLESDHQKKIEFLKYLERQQALAGAEKLGDYRDARDRMLANIGTMRSDAAGAAAKKLLFEKNKAKGGKAVRVGRPFDPEGDFFAAVDESQFRAQKKAADDAANAVDKYDEALKKSSASLYAATDAGRFDAMVDSLKTADEAFARGFINQDQLDAITAKLMEGTAALKEQESVARDLGMTFSSAFEDAILGGKKFSDVLKGLSDDIARIMLRRTVTEPLAEGVSSFAKGIDWKGLWPFADGGIMTGGGPLPLRTYSGGGIANRPQLALFGEGSVPEAFVPVPSGRIPVELRGGGGTVEITQHIHVDASADRASVMMAMVAAKEQAKAEIMASMRRGGAFA